MQGALLNSQVRQLDVASAHPCPHCVLTAGQSRPLRDWPEYTGEKNRNYVFFDGIDGAWWDNSWNTW